MGNITFKNTAKGTSAGGKKDTNISINSIEVRAVALLDELKLSKKQALYNQETKDALYEYVYGSGENPFDQLNQAYESKMEDLRERVEETAEIEKKNYLGKQKRGVKFVEKLPVQGHV